MDMNNNEVENRSHFVGIPIPVPTSKRDLFYGMNHKRRGIAVIFNHMNFTVPLEPRSGTDEDAKILESTLNVLGFETTIHTDLNLRDLYSVIDDLGNKDYADCDCLFIAVLSHGDPGVIYAKNSCYSPNLLLEPFTPDKCPTLAGKPKIYVIQACGGYKLDGGVDVQTVEIGSGRGHPTYQTPPFANLPTDGHSTYRTPPFANHLTDCHSNYRIPLFADFIIAYSTIPGYVSWREPLLGSWFIQALCEELQKHWQEFDLLTILTLVNGSVAFNFESNVPDTPSEHRQKQIPYVTTMLTRILKFTPKHN